MNKREIRIETNNFEPDFSGNFIYDKASKDFVKKVEIDLDELCAKYLLEEYNDLRPVKFFNQFPALNYLIEDIKEFVFQGEQPGASKDARKENSRVLGQTICRYFVEKTFGNNYMANIGSLLGRNLPGEFDNISIERKVEGDTPDFIFMDNNNKPCLAEAKGRRYRVSFADAEFESWRKQFNRVEVKIDEKPIEVKGYITELAIANESNKMNNSILYIEDPKLEGKIYEEGNLARLIKVAHYERLLSKTRFNFIGNSLLSFDKLSFNKKYKVNVYTIVGIDSHKNEEIVPLHDRYFQFPEFSDDPFIGISLKKLESLVKIARGNQVSIKDEKFANFNSVFFKFHDGFVVCNSYLVEFIGTREI